jgi:hypothetical protein
MPGNLESTIIRRALPIWIAAAFATFATEADADQVDLELVLAVDTSGSMSRAELLSQRQGYVAALRHPDFALALATRGSVAVAYVEWAGPNDQKVVVPWTVVSDAASAARLATKLEAAPLHPRFSSAPWEAGTSISEALLFSAELFVEPYASHVIDISGNGPNNIGHPLARARDMVVARGITINGLPIPGERGPDSGFPLAAYYENCVIGGPGAFALAVDDPSQFAAAVRRKMILEIAAAPPRPVLVAYQRQSQSRQGCEDQHASR